MKAVQSRRTGRWASVLLALLAAGSALATPALQLSDDRVGPTCRSYLGMGPLAWERQLGDWVDRAGTLYGEQPYASAEVKTHAGRQVAEFDVSALVRDWLAGRQPNHGFLLRTLPGPLDGVVEFHSRESPDLGGQPMLKLQWKSGERSRLPASADSFLDCSSRASLGKRPDIKISARQRGWLRFALPSGMGELASATLYLVSDKQYGRGARLGVFRTEPPFVRASQAVQSGLATRYPQDRGIARDPDVLFANGFESTLWMNDWSEWSLRNEASTLDSDPEHQFVPLQGKALRVTLLKGKNLGLDLRYLFGKEGQPEPEEIYFRYYLRLANDWDPALDGGKMPGIAGTYGRAGWGMRKTDGFNGWSARGGFALRPPGSNSVAGLTVLSTYSYHADIRDASGDIWPWDKAGAALLENNRWYAVEQYLKLNTPGEADGVMRAWVDGRQVLEKTDIRFRNTPDLKIETIWMDVYHGGVSPSPHDMSMYFDNVVIARKYIGPMRP